MTINESATKMKTEKIDHKNSWRKPRFWAIQTRETQTMGKVSGGGFGPGGPDSPLTIS